MDRVVSDTDLARYPPAGYPANNFAGYRISSLAEYWIEIFSFQQTLPTFWSLFHSYFIPSERVLNKVCSFEVRFIFSSV